MWISVVDVGDEQRCSVEWGNRIWANYSSGEM